MHHLALPMAASLALAAQAFAQITYVDADPSLNTILATGAPFVPNPATSGTDDNWSLRTFANGVTAYESHSAAVSNEDAPMLRTTISGLVPGVSHHVYAYFWGAATANANWRGRAVVDTSAPVPQIQGYDTRHSSTSPFLPMTPLGLGSPVGFQQTSLDLPFDAAGMETAGHFANPVMIQEGNRWLFEIALGAHMPNANGEITVYVDDLEGAVSSDNRTWFDGVGWEWAPQQYGNGCGNPTPQIGHLGAPVMTQDFTVTLTGAPANGVALLIVGFSSTTWGSLPLPLPLAFLGYGNCALNASLDLSIAMLVNGSGEAAQTFNLSGAGPADLYWQWGIFDQVGALSMTAGLSTRFRR